MQKKKNGEDFGVECILEVKGEIYEEKDKWKEDFMKENNNKEFKIINNIFDDKILKLLGLSFFKVKNNNNFEREFEDFVLKNNNKLKGL
ncbi:hypothetical protein [Campylobacter sp. LR196d]|uniref:hypothetical protein n=1 Tax=Campylobacter sp. LR196d TaxID=2593543 RepID=UPI0012388AC4|nr:hypothetical protein [Campylobacter sp. LR196d]KAA8603977.1 hypothetical protein CGP82_04870 [Campylobacter sp. LR185c]